MFRYSLGYMVWGLNSSMLRKLLIVLFMFAIGFSYSYAADVDTPQQNINAEKKADVDKKPEKSLMFSDTNISDIFKALMKFNINTLSPSQDRQDYSNLDGGNTNPTFFDENNISIYLNSILYISKTHWSVWVNENKITNLNNGDGEISVITISPLYATFAWKMGTSRWKIINANGMIPESKYKINDDEVVLFFGLSPNQTYIPATNKIIEGKIKREVPKVDNDNNGNFGNQNNQNQQNNLSNQDNLFF